MSCIEIISYTGDHLGIAAADYSYSACNLGLHVSTFYKLSSNTNGILLTLCTMLSQERLKSLTYCTAKSFKLYSTVIHVPSRGSISKTIEI